MDGGEDEGPDGWAAFEGSEDPPPLADDASGEADSREGGGERVTELVWDMRWERPGGGGKAVLLLVAVSVVVEDPEQLLSIGQTLLLLMLLLLLLLLLPLVTEARAMAAAA